MFLWLTNTFYITNAFWILERAVPNPGNEAVDQLHQINFIASCRTEPTTCKQQECFFQKQHTINKFSAVFFHSIHSYARLMFMIMVLVMLVELVFTIVLKEFRIRGVASYIWMTSLFLQSKILIRIFGLLCRDFVFYLYVIQNTCCLIRSRFLQFYIKDPGRDNMGAR